MKNNEHILNTYLDLGLIGERPVEVFYHWHNALPSNDRDQVHEGAYADVVAVMCWLDTKEVDVTDYLKSEIIDDLAFECAEDYLS